MTDADSSALARDLPRRSWVVAIAVSVGAAAAIELLLVVRLGPDQGLGVLPAFLGLAAVSVAVPAWVLKDRSAHDAEALVETLTEAGHPVFPILESRALHVALGTPRSPDEMVQSVAALVVEEWTVRVWAVRLGRAVELTAVDRSRIVAVAAVPLHHGRRLTRAVRLVLDDGSAVDLIVASRRGRWFAPAGDARFDEALRALRG